MEIRNSKFEIRNSDTGGRATGITFSQFLRIDQQRTRVEEAGPTQKGVNKNDLYQTPPSWLLPREPSFLSCFPSYLCPYPNPTTVHLLSENHTGAIQTLLTIRDCGFEIENGDGDG